MQMTKALIVMVLIFSAAAAATDKKQPPAPITWATTMPAIELSHQPLEKVLNEMKEKLPGFNFSISRINVPHTYPVLPVMRIENVSLEQFVQLLNTELPGVHIADANFAGDADFWNVNVTPNPNTTPDPPLPGVVRIFGLSETIAYQAAMGKGDGDREKKASDDILSLIQEAVEISELQPEPVFEIHPPTQTLIFKGTAAQAEIVSSALAALQPTPDRRTLRGLAGQDAYDRVVAENKQLKDELQKLKGATTKPSK